MKPRLVEECEWMWHCGVCGRTFGKDKAKAESCCEKPSGNETKDTG